MKKPRRSAEKEPEKSGEPQKEFEVDFDVKETGQKKTLAGYDTREVIMTVTVREKGKTLEDGGGFVMTADSWLGPQIAALKELGEFDQPLLQAATGPRRDGHVGRADGDGRGDVPDDEAGVGADGEGRRQAQGHAARDHDDLRGGEVQGADGGGGRGEQVAGGGGLGGMLARKMMKKDGEEKPRATIFTAISETQEVATSVAPADIDLPAGFKEKK